MDNSPRYEIRPLGETCWGATDDEAEARRLYHEARNRLSSKTVVIYDRQLDRLVSLDAVE